MGSDHGPRQYRGVADVETQARIEHRSTGRGTLCQAFFIERYVVPAGEEVELVPRAFAVAEDDERSGHPAMVGGTTPGHRCRVAGFRLQTRRLTVEPC